jgi:hypothetical protein
MNEPNGVKEDFTNRAISWIEEHLPATAADLTTLVSEQPSETTQAEEFSPAQARL